MRKRIFALLTAASMFVCASPAYVKAAGKHRGAGNRAEAAETAAQERLEHSRRWAAAPPPAPPPAPAPAPSTPVSSTTPR